MVKFVFIPNSSHCIIFSFTAAIPSTNFKMKLAILASLITAAAAFTNVPLKTAVSVLPRNFCRKNFSVCWITANYTLPTSIAVH
jgi:hypothetical protein